MHSPYGNLRREPNLRATIADRAPRRTSGASGLARHREGEHGGGVETARLDPAEPAGPSVPTNRPTNLADGSPLLGARPALLEGKILRGGMGTGMPYWGPISTSEQIDDLVSYLHSLHFDMEAGR